MPPRPPDTRILVKGQVAIIWPSRSLQSVQQSVIPVRCWPGETNKDIDHFLYSLFIMFESLLKWKINNCLAQDIYML